MLGLSRAAPRITEYRTVFRKRKRVLLRLGWTGVITRPTTGPIRFLSLTSLLEAVRRNGPQTTVQRVADELGQQGNENTVVIPALDALVQKGYVRREEGGPLFLIA